MLYLFQCKKQECTNHDKLSKSPDALKMGPSALYCMVLDRGLGSALASSNNILFFPDTFPLQ